MTHSKSTIANERKNWAYFENIPEFDRTRINVEELPQQQVQEPLFKYSLGEDGCSQGPYLKMISQLFGDRMLVANATGASSIFGGALPTTPWSSNSEGRGPAWSNSLFEDNAEFGLGFQLTQKAHSAEAHRLLFALEGKIDSDLIREILNNPQKGDACIQKQRTLVKRLKIALAQVEDKDAMQLRSIVDSLVKKSIWIVGGDGWAYDIGFGGLDHVLASGENVNVLVLDNELYSNTGGQQSKATPKGATANFVHNGKLTKKKDLGIMAMHYDNVYVASVAIGADPHHALRTLVEAESYDGPSLVIAYCPSNEHGAFSRNPMALQKAAVASGHWTLYRNDPRRLKLGLPKFQLDSERPTDKIEAYFELEGRFSKTLQHHPERLSDIQREINRRHNYLLSLSKTGQGLNYESLKYMQNETY